MPAEARSRDPLRAVVNIGPSQPELLEDLVQLPKRSRAARLRHLAAVGLLAIKGGAGALAKVAPAPSTSPDASAQRRRDRLVGRLGRVDD
ncbi:hypothetical protein [Thiocapsa marina]|uniref:Uncharacterized protein n=1 Tax=Thiocapsa marina 5811 TaxID=768671 RepID=F9UAH3_9GAMM|nr:hypothetical protein [Thiocapsa marina]EGV19121.1 hypothetical protein ThimaDRAFT_1925 [Thiocapsa marina 5811]